MKMMQLGEVKFRKAGTSADFGAVDYTGESHSADFGNCLGSNLGATVQLSPMNITASRPLMGRKQLLIAAGVLFASFIAIGTMKRQML